MVLDTQFFIELGGLLLSGGGLAVFFDRKQKKAALELENKQKQLELENGKESYAMTNIKESYDKLEQEYDEVVEKHKASIAKGKALFEENLELKKIISDKDIEINKLKAKNKELSTRLKNKGNGK